MHHDETQFDPEELATLRQRAIRRMTLAIDSAALQIQQMQEGRAPSGDRREKHFLDVIRMLPIVSRLTEPSAPAPAPISYDNWEYPKIPVCKICGQGPGAHWSADCPDNPNPPAIWRPE